MENKTHSPFAAALRTVIDGGTLDRAQWSEVLGVSGPAISQWVNDASVPRPENLRAIVSTALADQNTPIAALESLDAVLRQPAREVSPHGERMQPTIAHYMAKPLREGFLRTLETLPADAQEQVLVESAARCRSLRSNPLPLPTMQERRRALFDDLVDAAIARDAEQVGLAAVAGLSSPDLHMMAAISRVLEEASETKKELVPS